MNLEIFNPQNKPVDELPKIYGWNNGGSPGFYHAVLLAEDGNAMGSHVCSSEFFVTGDLGLLKGTRPDRHEGFRQHHPDGYQMVYIPPDQVKTHEGLTAACERNQALAEEQKAGAE